MTLMQFVKAAKSAWGFVNTASVVATVLASSVLSGIAEFPCHIAASVAFVSYMAGYVAACFNYEEKRASEEDGVYGDASNPKNMPIRKMFDGMTNVEKCALRKIAESGVPMLVSESGIDEYVLGSLADKGAVVNLSESNNHAISGWHRVSIDGRWLEFVRKNWNLMP